MRNVGLLVSRVILGGYLAVHGAQKLFGSFGGRGLEATAVTFDRLGLRPAKLMATVAGASELGGGVLTATGMADPLGPLVIAGTMAVASTVHRQQGPMSQKGGFELPLTNLAVALALSSAGSGRLRLGPRLSKSMTRIAFVGGAALAVASVAQLLGARPAVATAVAEDVAGESADPASS
jgi:putative oxidoreductase